MSPRWFSAWPWWGNVHSKAVAAQLNSWEEECTLFSYHFYIWSHKCSWKVIICIVRLFGQSYGEFSDGKPLGRKKGGNKVWKLCILCWLNGFFTGSSCGSQRFVSCVMPCNFWLGESTFRYLNFFFFKVFSSSLVRVRQQKYLVRLGKKTWVKLISQLWLLVSLLGHKRQQSQKLQLTRWPNMRRHAVLFASGTEPWLKY